MYSDSQSFQLPDDDLGEAGAHSRHVLVGADHDYYSLVEERWRDFIH